MIRAAWEAGGARVTGCRARRCPGPGPIRADRNMFPSESLSAALETSHQLLAAERVVSLLKLP